MPLFLILSDLEDCKGQKPMGNSSTSVWEETKGIRFTFCLKQQRQAIWNSGFKVTSL